MLRERILTMGIPGTGKSYQWLKIAENCPDSIFRCIDTDAAIDYMLETQFRHLKNVVVYSVFEWEDYIKSIKDIQAKEKVDDWFVLDMAEDPWRTVQRYYVEQVFQKDKGSYFLHVRKSIEAAKGKKGSLLNEIMSGWMDWPVVNSMYDEFILPIIFRLKSHVYMTTRPEALNKNDPPETKMIFGSVGVKPAGQKKLGHQVHTCFLFAQGADGDWKITTAKDRANRGYFNKTKLTSLHQQYMIAKAGWSV